MKYQVWDSASLGYLEPLVPFTKVFESDTFNDCVDYADNYDERVVLFVTLEDGTRLFNTMEKIFESPDGKTVYERNFFSDKRNKIK